MRIEFLNKSDNKKAKLRIDAEEFVINEAGNVAEYIDQSYANFSAIIEREDCYWKLTMKEK